MKESKSKLSTKMLLALMVVTMGLFFLMVACAPQAASGDSKSDSNSSSSTGSDSANGNAATVSGGKMGNNIGYPEDAPYIDNIAMLPEIYEHDAKDEQNALDNAPESYTDNFGFTVQPVPSDGDGYNISYLDADNRGCTACHTLEDALMSMDTYHGLIFMGYPTEQTYANCFVCHEWATPLRTSIHGIHNGSPMFTSMNGSCDSCHYINDDGDFKRWDYQKYDLYKGINDLSADEANLDITYDQETITPTEQVFFKTIKSYDGWDPSNWRTDDSNIDPSIAENWVYTVGGEVENPIEMTIPELIEQFGTKTLVMKQDCTVNGVGNATIFQVEVTGIPIADIIDYVKPKSGVNTYEMESEDPYPNSTSNYHLPLSIVDVPDALLVTEMNGETLPNSQGYPLAAWIPRTSAGDICKVTTGMNLIAADEATMNDGLFIGDFEDPSVGTAASKPNSAVLNYPTGVVLENAAGTEVTLEGFADAWDEPISKMEFSLDHGETWTVVDTPNNDPTYWTYWRMKFTPPEAGGYLLNIRTTSIMPDGKERVCAWDTQFLLNVK